MVVTEALDALRLDRGDLDQFLRRHPAAAIDLLSAMGRRLRVSAERLRHTASRNVNVEAEDKRTTVQKAADWIADFSGSIPFLVLHVVFFAAWILLNVPRFPGAPMFDPFPFGLLTMVVSLEAIFLSVFVLLSQNRQAAKERIRGDIEYEVNIKAEMEVAHLHEKVDLLNANAADTRRARPPPRAAARAPARGPERGRAAAPPWTRSCASSAAHQAADEAEARDVARVLDFVARHPDPFDRRIARRPPDGQRVRR